MKFNYNPITLFFRSLAKLKEIQTHRKQRKTSFIGSIKEALPSWAKKKSLNKYIQLQKLINETEDYEVREPVKHVCARESGFEYTRTVKFSSSRMTQHSPKLSS